MIDLSTVQSCIQTIIQVNDILEKFVGIDQRYRDTVEKFHVASQTLEELLECVQTIEPHSHRTRNDFLNNALLGLKITLEDTKGHLLVWAKRLSLSVDATDYTTKASSFKIPSRFPLIRLASLLKQVVVGCCITDDGIMGTQDPLYMKAAKGISGVLNRVDFYADGEHRLTQDLKEWEDRSEKISQLVALRMGRLAVMGKAVPTSVSLRAPLVAEVLHRVYNCNELLKNGAIRPSDRTFFRIGSHVLDREIGEDFAGQFSSRFFIPRPLENTLDPPKLLIDRRKIDYDRDRELIEEAVQRIAALFSPISDVNSGGEKDEKRAKVSQLRFLKCFGYEEPAGRGRFDIVFELPHWADPIPQSLRELLMEAGVARVSCSLDQRLRFATKLAEAVFLLQAMGIVHKNIRPENIFVLNKPQFHDDRIGDRPGMRRSIGRPYLLGFSQTRDVNGSTGMRPLSRDIARLEIYTHPCHTSDTRTHRFLPEDDLYSLGVCFIEIALWKSFSVRNDKNELDIDEARLQFNQYKHMLLTERWWVAKRRLLELAENDVMWAMGSTFSQVVVDCLRSRDRFGDEDDVVEEAGDATPHTHIILGVLEKLRAISV